MSILQVQNLTKRFAGVTAVDSVSFVLREGSIMGMIGPNGAGKSTVFRMINGSYRPNEGRVTFMERDITGLKPYQICQAGIAMTSQTTLPLMNMTVLQSAMIGSFLHCPSLKEARKDAFAVLEYLGLQDSWNKYIKDCNIPDRKKSELARALATRPKLLLLDELMAGLNPQEIDGMLDKIRDIRDSYKITLLFVEHLMQAVMSISEHIIVLDSGRLIAEGTPEQVSQNRQVITAYLGESYNAAS